MNLNEQTTKLANFIMAEIKGEPSQDEGAIDCAIRIMTQQEKEIQRLIEEVRRLEIGHKKMDREIYEVDGVIKAVNNLIKSREELSKEIK